MVTTSARARSMMADRAQGGNVRVRGYLAGVVKLANEGDAVVGNGKSGLKRGG